LKSIPKSVSLDTFQWFVKAIKVWADARAIKGNAFGFLGTYSWTILAAWVLDKIPEQEDSEDVSVLMTYFFDNLNQHDWASPIAIVEGHSYKIRGKQDRMPILTTIKPYYNSARNITRSTAKVLQQEFQRGHSILKQIKKGKKSWTDLFQAVTLNTTSKITLVIQAKTIVELKEACGWLEGHIVSLLITLEQLEDLVVRPYPNIVFEDKKAFIYLDVQTSQEDLERFFISCCLDDFKRSFYFDNKGQVLDCYYDK
jgi:poly(A) polymerase Pap1